MPKAVSKKERQPLWKGPHDDGITQSLFSKFIVCRHRFYLRTVHGLVEDEGFSKALEYGNMWHAAEEVWCNGAHGELLPRARTALLDRSLAAAKKVRDGLLKTYQDQFSEVDKWYQLCIRQFPLYLAYWDGHADEKSRKPLLEEAMFRVPYQLPSGRFVVLRGKFDAVCVMKYPVSAHQFRVRTADGIFIQENKSKGKVDEMGLIKTVAFNLQTQWYQAALRIIVEAIEAKRWDDVAAWLPGVNTDRLVAAVQVGLKPKGVLYNVIKRPLSDQYALKRREGRVVKGKPGRVGAETNTQFYDRVAAQIEEQSFDKNGKPLSRSPHFLRLKTVVEDSDIEKFKTQMFNPHMEQLLDWWTWIEMDPWHPFDDKVTREPSANGPGMKLTNNLHWQSPWGVYNSMWDGLRGDFFELLTEGREFGLTQTFNLFPELT